MKHLDLKSISLGVMVGAASILGIAAANKTAPKPIEYRVVQGEVFQGDFQTALNKAAAEGWKFEESNTFTERHAYAVMTREKK